MDIYNIHYPKFNPVPILVSVPHAGTFIPDDILRRFDPAFQQRVDDVDCFVDKLYGFAPEMGITLLKSNYCRWVVDLNRSPQNTNLYDDGRVITGIVPTTDFLGKPIYAEDPPDENEINNRIEKYYRPYHSQLDKLLQSMLQQFGIAILFDAHSIRDQVSSIYPESFPSFILGDNDGKSADQDFIDIALNSLLFHNNDVRHNFLFKGGYITRHYGHPESGIHALQLEMIKTNYMDDDQLAYHESRAAETQRILKDIFENLIKAII